MVCEVANDHCAAFRDSLAKQICAIIADLKKLGEENFFDLPPIARRKKKSGMIIFPSPSPLFVYGLVGENLTRFYKLVE